MRFECTSPFWLLGLIPCAIILLWLLRITHRHSNHWRTVCILLPGIAVALLTLALADPQIIYQPSAQKIILLLDLSPSTRTSPWQNPAWLHQLASQHLPSTTIIQIVGFTDHAQELCTITSNPDDPSWPLQWPHIDGPDTNIAAALAWHTDGADRTTPRWLITDGCAEFPASTTDPKLISSTPDQSPTGLASSRPSPPTNNLPYHLAATILPPPKADVGIANLQIQPLPAPNPTTPPPLELWATIQSTGPARGTIEFRRDGRTFAQRPLQFAQAGVQLLRVQDPAGTDHQALYEVHLSCNDPWPEDDTASIFAPPAGPPQVIVATRNPTPQPPIPGTTFIAPRDLPSTLTDLANTQLIVLDNLPLESLRPGTDLLLQHYVEDTGGGLLLTGATSAFGPGHYPQCELETLSPLASIPPHTPKHIIFLLDASGSMNEAAIPNRPGNKFSLALSGIQQSLQLLRPEDTVSIITFNATANLAVNDTVQNLPADNFDQLRQIIPTGATNPDSALTILPTILAPDSLLILLTDGEIPSIDIPHWSKLFADTKSHLAILAPPSNRGQLADLSRATHANWLATSDPSQWPSLLMQALEDQYAGAAMRTPKALKSISIAPLSGQTTRWIETFAKPEAQLYATSQDGTHPLAATARRGLGQVGAIAFADTGTPYASLLSILRQNILASPGDHRFTIQAQRQHDTWLITADGLEPHGFINNEHLNLHAIFPDGTTTDLPLPQIAPGKYQAKLAAFSGPFTVIITRNANPPTLIARLQPPSLPSNEWPAITTAQFIAPPVTTLLPPNNNSPWNPHLKSKIFPLLHLLILLASTLLLAALWLRRTSRSTPR